MGKINIGNIAASLEKVKSVTETLSNVSHFEMVPIEYIEPADYNPFADEDTDESRYEVAMSILANGLIEPLAVNKKGENKYKLISGEHRYTAIKQYLSDKFKNIPCMVFEGISDDEAELKLYEANSHREYTSEQKFKRYQELERLLRKMKDAGTYHGSIQKGLAERLNISTRQVRKYQTIVEKLTPEQQQAVIKGEISINEACKAVAPKTEPQLPVTEDEGHENDEQLKSGTGSAFHEDEQSVPSDSEEQDTVQLSESEWDERIRIAIKCHYDRKQLYQYYLFQVPTTQEAIRDILKPRYGYSGGVKFPGNVSGYCSFLASHIEVECGKERKSFTYSQVDEYVRKMIRSGELLSKDDIQSVITKQLQGSDFDLYQRFI